MRWQKKNDEEKSSFGETKVSRVEKVLLLRRLLLFLSITFL